LTATLFTLTDPGLEANVALPGNQWTPSADKSVSVQRRWIGTLNLLRIDALALAPSGFRSIRAAALGAKPDR
jgi:hypothetical protein